MHSPEILAPAGDIDSLHAAIRGGADAVYFGLRGHNARARATNFSEGSLEETMRTLHDHGVRGYVTVNTLVFDTELPDLVELIRSCAHAGVDALIVQDLGVMALARRIAPTLPLHASTQMTCTDAASVRLAHEAGASRVILAREMSLEDIRAIRQATEIELEVFVHGALCVAYSGQCLTSEAIGGRSANRGACAQACRLPYELVVDGEKRDLGDKAFLLSPEDLETSALVPELVALGVRSLKIEGRLKGPAYVAATTRLYRRAVDSAMGRGEAPSERDRTVALQAFSRGSGPGFFPGVDHQRLVGGETSDHRGVEIGVCDSVETDRGRPMLSIALTEDLSLGDGILVQGGFGGAGEVGGRIWGLSVHGEDRDTARAGEQALVWLGPEKVVGTIERPRPVFRTSGKAEEKEARSILSNPEKREIQLRVSGAEGERPVFEARLAGREPVSVEGEAVIERALTQPLSAAILREKLGQLGETPFRLGELELALPEQSIIPLSSLKKARRALVAALQDSLHMTYETTDVSVLDLTSGPPAPAIHEAPSGLFVLCRTLEQAEAALDAGADGVYLDFLELTGMGAAVRALRARPMGDRIPIGVAPPRIRKPGEEKIEKYQDSLSPDAVLVRSLGALYEGGGLGGVRVGDFSLNVTNGISARYVLARGLSVFTPSFDLDATQLLRLLTPELAPRAEVVLHHPMPLFHMEHCVFAALLSNGGDYKTCGRPCEQHKISLRDRAGMDHPVEADVGCRNTVFHAAPQSAAGLFPHLKRAGVRRYRIELVRETRAETTQIVETYKRLFAGQESAESVWATLKTQGGYGVVRGSLRVL